MKNFDQFVDELYNDIINESELDRIDEDRIKILFSFDSIYFNMIGGQIETKAQTGRDLRILLRSKDRELADQAEIEIEELHKKFEDDETFKKLNKILQLYMINVRDSLESEVEKIKNKYL